MAVKIIEGATDARKGVINNEDLTKLKNDFVTETDLTGTHGRTKADKTFYCFLFKEQIDDLFYGNGKLPILKISFALHLNPTKEFCSSTDITNKDISDSLTIVIESAADDANRTPRNGVGDYVVIPAYANKSGDNKFNDGFPCCPSAHP